MNWPKVSSRQMMQLLLLERSLFLALICCSVFCLGEDGYFYHQQDYPAPNYYQELLYQDENYQQPYYQEEFYQEGGGGGGYHQNWRRQDLQEEEDEESPIPVIIKGSLLKVSRSRSRSISSSYQQRFSLKSTKVKVNIIQSSSKVLS